MKRLLSLLIISIYLMNTFGQTSFSSSTHSQKNNGIKWDEGLSWQEVKEKAGRENKYIFLDCYATWCGPCKRMDNQVYVNDSLGYAMNDKFISVKVQMDKTKGDNTYIQSWYKDAAEISRHYLLEVYPTFLFFNPAGEIIHKDFGFKEVDKFISMVQTAMTPEKKWNDDYAEYEQLMVAFKQGTFQYDKLPFMATISKKIGDTVSRELIRLHENYVAKLSKKERYTKDNISFWSTLNLTSNRKILQFFFKDGEQIDRLMEKKGYAQAYVDKCIQNTIVNPFIYSQMKDPNAKSGVVFLNSSNGTIVSKSASHEEADWQKLYLLIRKDFDKKYSIRNLQKAKSTWYERHGNWIEYANVNLEMFKSFPPNVTNLSEAENINNLCWDIFININEKKYITQAIYWMEKLVQKNPHYFYLDTYANLLYKAGKKNEAIIWEEKAINSTPPGSKPLQWYKDALEQMKRGEFTYGIKW